MGSDTYSAACNKSLRLPMAKAFNCVPPSLRRYHVSRQIVTETAERLKSLAAGVRESVVLWQGRVLDNERAEITKLHVPEQDTSRIHFDIPLEERLRILREIA